MQPLLIYFREPPRWVENVAVGIIIFSAIFLAVIVPLVLTLLEKEII